jgi:hypothetical protein
MKALLLGERTLHDIDGQVAKILRGLGNPDPPLDLRLVRELLSLDHAYYSVTEDGAVRESVSRLIVAGKQVLKRPTLLAEAIKKLSLRALYLPDQRRILIDADQPRLKHRWNEGHEIGHSIIPWHQGLMGDDELTLTPACHAVFEAEANFAAGQLLFLGNRFLEEAKSLDPGFSAVDQLAKRFGNTKTSTLWRYIERVSPGLPVVGVISGHPHVLRRDPTIDLDNPCKHVMQSTAFHRQFSNISEASLFQIVSSYCGAQHGGILGTAEVLLQDDNGGRHVFRFETFYNRYEALTLGIHERQEANVFAGGDWVGVAAE